MTSSAKANGKAKHTTKDQHLFTSASAAGNRLGLPPVKLGEEMLQPEPERDWPEWSQVVGITGARARLIVDDWEGQRSKWTVRTTRE
ncbi:hypothetical protein AGABI1DRAFT_112832 [Agaricus bisporus var. burnettii JB137-S8]|uniref:Uncharacterized protein n=2 Tax=Agaricus bisporus var. burnettii TaxID=192524 RepID=K5Y091_AGABU|nr:uncharacterized protein AGABI1DRAFT_112832 [Agaricus bisporus var. burnettii JB137-S8]EKM81140.1 hypothetical protein AGABI1DRAFT_112832 [Agaricus bisporus var. burnettii JB137-S8]KAF7783166.1 hypothetical protein Agabi119p4_2542 [Agaricus bisporus var. burnettii]